MSRLSYYLRLFPYHVSMNIQAKMSYSFDFFLGMIANGLRQALGLIFIQVIFLRLPSIEGWSFSQVAFVYGMQAMCLGLNEFFFAGTWSIPKSIRDGEFDRILLRPVNTFYSIMTADVTFHGLGSFVFGLILCIYSLKALGIRLSFGLFIFWIVAVFCGTMIFFSINLVGATFSIWIIDSTSLMMAMQSLSELAKYPIVIYRAGVRFFISFVFPYAFVSYYPSIVLLGKNPNARILTSLSVFLISALCFVLSRAFWSYGLSKYQSAGA